MNPTEHVIALLEAGPICDHCLGQQLARIGHGLSAQERGRVARAIARPTLQQSASHSQPCWVCENLFDRVPAWAEEAARFAARYEFSTFLFGARVSPRLEATQEFLSQRFPSPWAEPVRREVNRCLGRAFERVLSREGRSATVDFTHPHVRFTVDLERESVSIQVSPVFFAGRYRKLIRGIPQTHWPCRACKGHGCNACRGTGKQYPESVEELIVPAFVRACGGTGGKLHGAGREDVDARMLGRGRPFVVEVSDPQRRRVDLEAIASAIEQDAKGKVQAIELAQAEPGAVERLKGQHADKRYRMKVEFDAPVTAEMLAHALSQLVGPIKQRTPQRVRHRRADVVRPRRLHSAQGHLVTPKRAHLELLCEGGLYVKELVSGDQGATEPNLSHLLGVQAQVTQLDVLEVLDLQASR